MISFFITLEFLVELIIIIVWGIIIYLGVRYYNSDKKTKDIRADFIRVPTNNTLVVIGILVPIFVALAAYLYTKNPQGSYASLLASITLMFFILILAIWQTYAILKKATTQDYIQLEMPEDRRYITCMGLMYGYLILGLIYFAYFFLVELTPPPSTTLSTSVAIQSNVFYIGKPRINLDQSRDELIKSWGTPKTQNSQNTELTYESSKSKIRFVIDNKGNVIEIHETK